MLWLKKDESPFNAGLESYRYNYLQYWDCHIMPEFAVSEEKNRWLRQKMSDLRVREEDLLESFVRSSGNGGQHVNKTSSCVQLKHMPTGIQVTCMRERSQSVNRFLARRELLERIEAASGVITPEMKSIEKLRKQKDRRRRRATTA
jgi:protein subunit release factor B